MEQINTTIIVNKRERQEIAEEIKELRAQHYLTPGLDKVFDEILSAVQTTVAQAGFNYRLSLIHI